jgi:alpha-L-fucosidase 2
MTGFCGGQRGIGFACTVQAVAENGRVFTLGDNLLVEKADNILLVLSAATSFRHKDFKKKCRRELETALKKGYNKLYARHAEDYRQLFDRVRINLGNSPEKMQMPTDERLAALRAGGDDPGLASLYFQFGRYLLISCSRPGTLPANLQGSGTRIFIPHGQQVYHQHQYRDELLAC